MSNSYIMTVSVNSKAVDKKGRLSVQTIDGVTALPPPKCNNITIEYKGGYGYDCKAYFDDGTVKDISAPVLRDKPDTMTVEEWISVLHDIDIHVGAKVYSDLWNFVDGSDLYRQLSEAFQNEHTRRSQLTVKWEEGTLRYNGAKDEMETFVGGRWIKITTTNNMDITEVP